MELGAQVVGNESVAPGNANHLIVFGARPSATVARYTPAGQPSVRVVSSAIASAPSSQPAARTTLVASERAEARSADAQFNELAQQLECVPGAGRAANGPQLPPESRQAGDRRGWRACRGRCDPSGDGRRR